MTIKVPGAGGAVGYWGNNIHGRILAEQVPEKVSALLIDKITAMGLPLALWMEVPDIGVGGVTVCSCVGATSKQPDRPCMLCYGVGRIPGFKKFGTTQYWKSSTDTWTLSNMEVNRDFAPYHLGLTAAATTGSATIGPFAISTVGKLGSWEFNVYAACRDSNTAADGGWTGTNSLVYVEWSTNGSTWRAMSTLASQNPATGNMYFRVTMTRTAVTVKSPLFGIVRIRFPRITDIRMLNGAPEVDEPIIRGIETWDNEVMVKEPRSMRTESNNQKFWTLPLSIFDTSLTRDAEESRIQDTAFVEQRYGANMGVRFPILDFSYSDKFGIFTRQEFNLRRAQGEPGNTILGEQYGRVF
jgi:hypothetical protein